MKYKILSVLLLAVVLVSVVSCSNKTVHMSNFKEITPEDFCETYNKIFDAPIGMIDVEDGKQAIASDYSSYRIEYFSYCYEEDARDFFEDYYERSNEYSESHPDEIQMNISDDRGYIIYDITGAEQIAEATQDSLRDIWDRYNIEPFVPAIDFETYEPTEYELTNENIREICCIYYCDDVCIHARYTADSDEDPSEFIAFLDALGLPHM